MSKVRTIPLIKWLALAMVAFITFGALFIYQEDTGLSVGAKNADENEYDSVALAMQLPTAFNDFIAKSSRGKESDEAKQAVDDLISEHYGNVGLLIGPRDSSGFSSTIGAYLHPNSIAIKPRELREAGFSPRMIVNLNSYLTFGRAVQDLSDRGSGLLSSTAGAQDSLDVVANTATGISRAGMKILIDYSPGPIIKQMYTGQRATAVADSNFVEADGTVMTPGHKLVSMLEGTVMGEVWEALSMKPLGDDVPVTLTTLILAIIIVLTAIGGIIMTLSGGRGGESMKKIAVRIVVASTAIPLAGMILHWGLVGAAAVTDYDISQEERDARHAIGNHLNLAGWADTGFRVPEGMKLEIRDGRFSLTQAQIRALNIQSYFYKMYDPDLAGDLSMEHFENLIETSERHSAINIYEDMKETARDNLNLTMPHFSMRSDGDALEIMNKAAEIGSLNWRFDEDEDAGTRFSYIDADNFTNKIEGVSGGPSGDGYNLVVGTGEGTYGMSPISAYHIFYSDFTGNAIKARQNARLYTTVVFHASNGKAGTNADGSEAKTGMNGFIKLIAIFTVSIASLKGLGQIMMSGFGGLISGTARSSVGSSAGFGQAIGGVIALVGGVIGMSFIIHISFELLDAIYDIISYLFKDADGADVMRPIAESIKDGLPKPIKWVYGWLAGVLVSIASFIISFIAFLAVPKFGKIPIEMFAANMAELPGNMADRAQQMENRFTGDFRGGGGGGFGGSGSRVGSSVGSALKSATGQAKGLGQAGLAAAGIGTGLLGMGISKVADKLSNKGDKSESLSTSDIADNPDDPPITDDPNNPPVGEQQSPDEKSTETPANETAPNEKTVEQDSADTTISETDALNEQDGADQLTEVEQENETFEEGAEIEQDSETLGGEVETEHVQSTDQEQSIDKEVSNEQSTDHTEGAKESISNNDAQNEQVQNTSQEQSVDSEVSNEHTAGANDSVSQENSETRTDGGDHSTTQEGGTSETSQESIQENSQEHSMDNQSMSDNQSLSDKQVESSTSEKSDTQSTNTSSTTDGSSNDNVGESPTGESISGDGTTPTSTPTDGSKGAGIAPSGDTSLNVDGGPKPTPTNANQNMNVRNENKATNKTSNESKMNSTVGGDTHIDGGNDTKGESLGAATNGGGAPPSGPGGPSGPDGPDKTGDKKNNAPQTKAQKTAGAMKRVVTKDNAIKALGAVGKGLQAAGGEVSAKRFGAAVLHAAASATGLQDKFNTKAVLDKASGKAPQQQQEQQKDQKDNKQQNRRQTINEQMLYYIKQQQENDRRPPRK